jgi:hypothetical protein
MKSPQNSNRLLKSTLRTCLVCAAILCGNHTSARATSVSQGGGANPLSRQHFFCDAGYDRQECQQHAAMLRALLIRYPASGPADWSWVMVRTQDWRPLMQRLHLDRHSPAFTALDSRETFLEEALFMPQSPRTEELARIFRIPADQLLSFVVTHELGHTICHDGSETTASMVAEQLRRGNLADCVKSLSAIQELYLHSQSHFLSHLP